MPKIIDEIANSIRETWGLVAFKHFKHPTLSDEDKIKFEDAIIEMMYKFKYVPIKFGNIIHVYLYN